MAAEHGPGRRPAQDTAGRPAAARLALAVLLAAVVTGVLVIAGRVHQPDYAASIFGQAGTGALAVKSWLASIAVTLAAGQVLLALWLYRKLPGLPAPGRWVGRAHRLAGVILIAVTLPVATHCLIAYGVELTSVRVAVHSLGGCFLYGVFVAKVLLVRSRRLPGWVLPAAGGMLAAVVAVIWYTAALWYFHGYRLPGL
jgi:Family of unknown function (DUF6529)